MCEMTLGATTENLAQVTAFVDDALSGAGCPLRVQMQFDVAIDEVFSNIVRYAYAPGTGDVVIRFAFDAPSRTVSVAFIDSGIPFNPLEQAAPDVTLGLQEREIGGLGIFLVRKLMDAVTYRREDGKNILTLQKRI